MKETSIEDLLIELEKIFSTETKTNTLLISKKFFNGDHEKAVGLLKSLTGKEMIKMELKEKSQWILTDEGLTYTVEGSPEYRTWKYVQEAQQNNININISNIKENLGNIGTFGLSTALKTNLLKIDGPEKRIICISQNIEDICKQNLNIIHNNSINEQCITNNSEIMLSQDILQDLKKRKLINLKKTKYYDITKSHKFSLTIKEKYNDLTSEMLANDTWKEIEFKPYNFFAAGKRHLTGSIHPLSQMLIKFKKVFLSMGFEEMPTNRWVESSFWNFDSLFMPQQHPARDAQDTFFIKNPEYSNKDTFLNTYSNYIDNVSTVHTVGAYGSLGWRSEWLLDESMKNVLRTHTTGISTHVLYEMCKKYKETGIFQEKRLFSIDRVFRNETIDATHLAEFHQVEGLIAQKGMSLATLMGTMKTFYYKCGISDIRFKPTFNPYTEPSMEIFGFHPILQKWIEVGNSGVFRPEVTDTMDIPSDVTVIAWGLSLERPTMIKYGINNIRDLFGAKAILTTPLQV